MKRPNMQGFAQISGSVVWLDPSQIYADTHAFVTARSDLFADDTYNSKSDKTLTPTLEELSYSTIINTGSISATTSAIIYSAPFAAQLDAASFTVTTDVAASDTDYWTFTLYRYRYGTPLAIGTKTTKTVASGGEGFSAWQPWTFSNVTLTFNHLAERDTVVVTATKTGAPADLVGLSVTLRTEPADGGADVPLTIASDNFTRNDASSLGTATTGQTWVNGGSGTMMHIVSNTAQSAGAADRPVINSGTANCTVQAKLATSTGSMGLALRMPSDTSTGYVTNLTTLFKFTAPGTNTSLGSFSQTFVAGDTIRINMASGVFTVYRQAASTGSFIQVLQVTNTDYTGNYHGIRASAVGCQFDDFLITVP